MSSDMARRVRAVLPPPFILVVQRKGWVNNETMLRFVKELAECLQHRRATRRYVVYMDAYRAHLSPSTLEAFGKADLCVAIIPALVTWALQPCDTHLFAIYKRTMATMGQLSLLKDPAGAVNWERTMTIVRDVCLRVLHGRTWRKAFEDLGLCGHQRLVSVRTKEKLGFEHGVPVVSTEIPELLHLQQLFPAGSIINFDKLFSALLIRERGAAVARPAPPAEVAPVSVFVEPMSPPLASAPWFGRTRSTSAQAKAISERSSSSSCPTLPRTPATLPPPLSHPPMEPVEATPLPPPHFCPRPRSASFEHS